MTLTVLCGLPGAGKSTWAAVQPGDHVVLTADAIRTERANASDVFTRLFARLNQSLRKQRNVIVDTCALRAFDRAPLLHAGRKHGARCELVFFCVPWRVCRDRDRARDATARIVWPQSCAHAFVSMSTFRKEGWDVVRYVPEYVPPDVLFL